MTEIEITEAVAREQSLVSQMTVGDFLSGLQQPHRKYIAVEIAAACMARVLEQASPIKTTDYLPPLTEQVVVRQRLDAERAGK